MLKNLLMRNIGRYQIELDGGKITTVQNKLVLGLFFGIMVLALPTGTELIKSH